MQNSETHTHTHKEQNFRPLSEKNDPREKRFETKTIEIVKTVKLSDVDN